MRILSVGRALPDHYYDQEELTAALLRRWESQFHNKKRLETLHRNVLVGGRHLALAAEEYEKLDSFSKANDAFIRCAVDLGERAITDGVRRAGIAPHEIDHIFFVSVTGIATPSVDARLINRLGLRPDVKRTPIFGLGCVGGAAGISRAADYLKAYPQQIAVLLSVELCSLTLQRTDASIANLIASGLFGDGAAAVVMGGAARNGARPAVIDTRSVFYPGTEHVMGWQIGQSGFRIVLSTEVPAMARRSRRDADRFLATNGLELSDIDTFVCHPGGPRVLEAFAEAFELPSEALALTWRSLTEIGNLSSASVLMVLRDTMESSPPPPGAYGLLTAMGPGFCSELVLLQW